MIGRTMAFATVVLASGLLVRSQTVGTPEPLRYAKVIAEDARILNLADDKGIDVLQPPPGTLLAVFEELEAGWLAVETPGGFPVWVYGRYLQPSEDPEVFQVTRNAVNIRPHPSSDVTNFPLPQRLHAGDRVRLIEFADPTQPLAETWVRVWSPPGVRAWIRASSTQPLSAGEQGKALWDLALTELVPLAPPLTKDPVKRSIETAAEVSDREARAFLDAARTRLEAEREKSTPDFEPIRSELNTVLEKSPTGPVAMEARQELRLVATLEEAAALRSELERERERRAMEALSEQQEVWERARAKDPLGEVFLSRGVLVREVASEGTPRYFLRFGGEVVCELFCVSGRYDLDLFAGYEIGVHGGEILSSEPTEVPGIQISKLEIIARR